jgi:hypothetical protein
VGLADGVVIAELVSVAPAGAASVSHTATDEIAATALRDLTSVSP